MILESLKPYRELLNVLGNLDKRADKKKKKSCLIPVVEIYAGEDWGGAVWLLAEVLLRQYL